MQNEMIKKHLVTDSPQNMTEAMLNFAYAKNGKVYLSYADGTEDIDLCEYVSHLTEKQGCNLSANDVMEGSCIEWCDCEVAILYSLAVQAAELRERLKHYESLEEQGLLQTLPCKVGDTLWVVWSYTKAQQKKVYPVEVYALRYDNKKNNMRVCVNGDFKIDYCDGYYTHHYQGTFSWENIGKTVFFTKEDAEKKLKGGAEG